MQSSAGCRYILPVLLPGACTTTECTPNVLGGIVVGKILESGKRRMSERRRCKSGRTAHTASHMRITWYPLVIVTTVCVHAFAATPVHYQVPGMMLQKDNEGKT